MGAAVRKPEAGREEKPPSFLGQVNRILATGQGAVRCYAETGQANSITRAESQVKGRESRQ